MGIQVSADVLVFPVPHDDSLFPLLASLWNLLLNIIYVLCLPSSPLMIKIKELAANVSINMGIKAFSEIYRGSTLQLPF